MTAIISKGIEFWHWIIYKDLMNHSRNEPNETISFRLSTLFKYTWYKYSNYKIIAVFSLSDDNFRKIFRIDPFLIIFVSFQFSSSLCHFFHLIFSMDIRNPLKK